MVPEWNVIVESALYQDFTNFTFVPLESKISIDSSLIKLESEIPLKVIRILESYGGPPQSQFDVKQHPEMANRTEIRHAIVELFLNKIKPYFLNNRV